MHHSTVVLSVEGAVEIIAEMNAAPANSPERRATFDRARAARALVRRMLASASERRG